MRTLQLIIRMFVIGIAWSVLSRPAKIQDRMVTDGDRRFCAFYYAWRETQAGGGVPAVDRLCFDAQEMMPLRPAAAKLTGPKALGNHPMRRTA